MVKQRIVRLILAAFTLACLDSPVVADLDRDELNEKEEAEAKPELGGIGGSDDATDQYENLARRGEKNLREINRLLEEIQNNLGERNTGQQTQEKQKQAVQRLEKLIQELAEAAKASKGAGSQSQQPKPQQPSEGEENKQQQRRQQQESMQNQRQNSEKKMSPEKQPNGEQEQNDQEDRHTGQRREATQDDVDADASADRPRHTQRWGSLPSKVMEALSSSDKEPPAQYREIIARYYTKLSDHYSGRR